MKWFIPSLLAAALVPSALGQSAPAAGSPASAKPARATIAGIVTKEPGSEPVKKALIELIAENQTEGGDYTAVSGPDGSFRMEGILPGRYRLFVERTGYVEHRNRRSGADGRVLTLSPGQEVTDLQIRLQASAVVRGRVTDEDGDPMAGAEVSVLRQTYASGRSRWEQAGADRTNDLGEYRVANLAAGTYFVSVNPPPDFGNLIASSGAEPEVRSASPDKPALTYQTTFYPGTADRSQAAPIQVKSGDEFPVNFSLAPSPTLSIAGAVVNLPPGASAVIMLQSRDFNLTLNGADVRKDGTFVIRDVAPGSYTITASVENGAPGMMARQALQIAGNNVDDVRLAPQPGAWLHGRVRLENSAGNTKFDPTQFLLNLKSSDGDDDVLSMSLSGAGFSPLVRVNPDGTFEWKGVPPGNYFVQLSNSTSGGANWYLRSESVDGRDLSSQGIPVSGGVVPVDLLLSPNGAVVDGIVSDAVAGGSTASSAEADGMPGNDSLASASAAGAPPALADAIVVAVPDARWRVLSNRYFTTVSDQTGRFTLRGLPPGDYTLYAWESLDGEAYLNPDFLKTCEGQGTALHVSEGDHRSLRLTAIPSSDSP